MTNDHIIDSVCRLKDNYPAIYNKWNITRHMMDNFRNKSLNFNDMSKLPSVRIVFTSDTSKWTRCPVLEMCDDHTQSEGNARRFQMRSHASVDKLGRTIDQVNTTADVNDPGNPCYISETGMGWFPGYAINTVTGERLNIMFGEDSRFIQYNGTDMLWNPTFALTEGTQNYVMGGRHFIYVMNATSQPFYDIVNNTNSVVTSYKNSFLRCWSLGSHRCFRSLDRLMNYVPNFNDVDRLICNHGVLAGESTTLIPQRDSAALFFASVAWVNMPFVNPRYKFQNPIDIPCDVTIDLDVNSPYGRYLSGNGTHVRLFPDATVQNDNYPMYMFELTPDIATLTGQATSR